MSLPIEDPDWPEILDALLLRRLRKVHTAAPGTIVSYDETAQTATVQLTVQEEAGDVDTFVTVPPLTDVPIAWPAGGGYAITMPLAAGDPVEVIFQEVDDSNWRGTGEIAPPLNLARHGLQARAVPCGGLDSKQLPAQTGKLVISSQNGSGPGVVLDGSTVEIGGGADFVALAAKVDAQFTALAGAFSGWTPVALDGGAALKTLLSALATSWPSPTAATKVKAT